jgi:Holliday junction DNA helicase RuvB
VHGEAGSRDAVQAALTVFDIDDHGLDRLDRAVLVALVVSFRGGPAGIATLASAVGEERDTVESVVEPYLVRVGLIARTPRGRIATPAAWELLGKKPPSGL